MSNRFNITYAHPGFCTLCHCEIADFEGFVKFGNIMRPKVIRLKSNFRQGLIELSDSSYMTVSLCEKCINFGPEDCGKIYKSEMCGWEKEAACFDWSEESKPIIDSWLKRQSELEVTDRKDVVWTDGDRKKIKKPKLEVE